MNDVAGIPALALILFAPWFLILSTLFWLFPRQPRTAARTRRMLSFIHRSAALRTSLLKGSRSRLK